MDGLVRELFGIHSSTSSSSSNDTLGGNPGSRTLGYSAVPPVLLLRLRVCCRCCFCVVSGGVVPVAVPPVLLLWLPCSVAVVVFALFRVLFPLLLLPLLSSTTVSFCHLWQYHMHTKFLPQNSHGFVELRLHSLSAWKSTMGL